VTGALKIQLLDLSGRILDERELSVVAGKADLICKEVLVSGVYILKIKMDSVENNFRIVKY
jgi:hypothetical protein